MIKRFCLLLTIILFSTQLFGQDELTKSLTSMLSESGKAYVGPVSSAFGGDLNSGWVHRAVKAKTWGIDLEFGVIVMGAMFNDDVKTFKVNSDFRFDRATATSMVNSAMAAAPPNVKTQMIDKIVAKTYTGTVSGPTIVGKKSDNVLIQFPGESITVNGTPYSTGVQNVKTAATGVLDDLKMLPLMAPQISVGTLFGTMISVRYLPSVKIDDNLGEFKYMGFGLQHNPTMWIPIPMPLDLSVGFFTQNLEVGKYFKSSATTFGAYASKQFGPGGLNITPYAGFALESSKLEVAYNVELKDVPIVGKTEIIPMKFELEGDNASRIIVGLNFRLGPININADYNISKINIVSAGLNFAF